MSELFKFCLEKGLSQEMEDAFVMFCKSTYANEYLLRKEGDTIKLRLERMTRPQVEDAWNKYLSEWKKILEG